MNLQKCKFGFTLLSADGGAHKTLSLVTNKITYVMKDFMLIFIGADYGELGLSPEQMQQRMGKWFEWHGKMESAGIIKSGEALHPTGVRISGPERTVTDRAATELKELVGGYYVIAVADMEAAKAVAQDFPDFDLGGTVEIREVMVFDQ